MGRRKEKKPPDLQRLVSGFRAAGAKSSDLEKWVETGKGTVEGDAQLLSWDANSIHAFVFGTTNASGIRGASDYLAKIDTSMQSGSELRLSPDQILFAGGGSGMAVVEAAKVGEVTERLHAFFARSALVATCSVGSAPLAGALFRDQIAAASRKMARNRLEIGPDPEPFVPFFAERCRVCGQRAASVAQKRWNDDGRLECLPCRRSVNNGKIEKSKRGEKPIEEQSFQEIADRKEGGYYAVLYADGNGVGSIIQTLCSPWQYARFSYLLDYLVSKSFDAIVDLYRLKNETGDPGTQGAHQRAICAGDDIVAVIPGEIAVPLSRDLLRIFEENVAARPVHPDLETSELDLSGLALSAGVTMAQVRMPVRHLLQEAEELLKHAKSRHYSRPDRSKGLSSLDFSVLRDGSPRAETRGVERSETEKEQHPLTSGRPFTLAEMEHFSARYSAVLRSKIGKTQLYDVCRYAKAGWNQLRNHILYQAGRDEGWRELLEELERISVQHGGVRQTSRAERYMAQILPTYGGRQVFDLVDMVELHRLWLDEADMPEARDQEVA